MKKGLTQIVIIAAAALLISTSLVFAFLQKNKTSEKLIPSPSPVPQYQTDETVYKDEGSANWKTYTNSTYKYSLRYPNDWTIVDSLVKPDGITFSSSKTVEGSPALISIYVRETKDLNSQWQEQYKPFYAIESKQKGENTYILRASSYEEGVGISKERERLAVGIFDLTLSTFQFIN